MAIFTAFVLAAFVSYAGAWYMGMYDGNFALLLFTATVVTGVYWLAERFYFLPQRLSQAQALEDEALARREELTKMGIQKNRCRYHPRPRAFAHAALVVGLDCWTVPGDIGGVCAPLFFV